MDFNSPCDGCRHPDSMSSNNHYHCGLEAVSEWAISDTQFSDWPDHLGSLVEYQRRGRHGARSAVSTETGVRRREEHIAPAYEPSTILSLEASATRNVGVQVLNRGAREKTTEPQFISIIAIKPCRQHGCSFTLATPRTQFYAAGVDMFHCSTRRFWEAEFPETGSNMNLAG
jgi:hypothetical protein